MVKKVLFLATVLAIVCSLPSMAKWKMRQLQVKGTQISFADLKAGDRILLQNASGTLDMAYTSCKYQVLDNVFLNGEYKPWDSGRLNVTDQSQTISENDPGDQLWEVVDAPAQYETVGGSDVKRKSIYLKHVKTGLYICADNEDGSSETCNLGSLDKATSFWVQQALDPEFEEGKNAYGSTWITTGNVGEKTAVFTHIYDKTKRLHFGPFWNFGHSYYGTAVDIIPWNLWTQSYSSSYVANLRNYYSEIKNSLYDDDGIKCQYGENAGYYTDEDAIYQMDEMIFKLSKYDIEGKGEGIALTDDDAKDFIEQLDEISDAMEAARVPFKEGYWRFISAYWNYLGGRKAIEAGTDHTLRWDELDEENAYQIYQVTKAEKEGEWYIQNIITGEYMGATPELDGTIPLNMEAEKVPMLLVGYGYYPEFAMKDAAGTCMYQADMPDENYEGRLCNWDAGYHNSSSGWYPEEVTDMELIERLKSGTQRAYVNSLLQNAVQTGLTTRYLAFNYDKLVTDPSKIKSNTGTCGYNMKNLIDDDKMTYYESDRSGTVTMDEHNIQFDLTTATKTFRWYMCQIPRALSEDHGAPCNVTLYATNDETLGADSTSANEGWTKIADYDKDFITIANVQDVDWMSPEITMPKAYRFLRFVVHEQTQSKQTAASFVAYFNAAEFQILNSKYNDKSEYLTVTGMKTAVNKLDAMIADLQNKIANNTGKSSDTTAIYAGIRKVRSLYVDRESFDREMKTLEGEADLAYKTAMGKDVKLVSSAENILVNSKNEGVQHDIDVAYMIDGIVSGTYNGIEAIYDDLTLVMNKETTADQWLQWLKANRIEGKQFQGIGYRNYQVALDFPVDNFFFNIVGRDKTEYHDTPCEWDIYATNDDALGASADNADNAKWTFIKNVVAPDAELPNERAASWTSPTIELGAKYKYIRFVIKETTGHKAKYPRTEEYAHPEITGIIWNAIEWQLYSDLPEEQAQGLYNPELKTALDDMMKLKKESEARESLMLYDDTKIKEFQAAIDKVNSLYADTTELVKYYDFYNSIANNATVGEGVGYVDAQASIDAYASSVKTAKALTSPTQPTKASIKASLEGMAQAYKDFEPHVTMPEAGAWYNIVSATTRAEDQPIYLRNLDEGSAVRTYTYHDNEMTTDPYTIFRLIAANNGLYKIQSLGTGQYLSIGTLLGETMVLSHNGTEFKLWYFGDGTFKIQNPASDITIQVNADQNQGLATNWAEDVDRQREWKFQPADTESGLTIAKWYDKNIQIMTLPFETKGETSLMTLNENVKTYAIKSMTYNDEGTILILKEKQDFEAGEPFIIQTGDYTAYDPEGEDELAPLVLACPADVVDEATIANGIVGSLYGGKVTKPGLAYFSNNQLKVTDNSEFIYNGRGGYIDASQVTSEEGEGDLVIVIGEIANGVDGPTATSGSKKAYTIDGVYVGEFTSLNEALKAAGKNGVIYEGKKVK